MINNSKILKVHSIKELSTCVTQKELFATYYNQNDYSNIGTVDKISVPNGAFPKVGELAQAEIAPTSNDLYFVLNPIKNPKERRNQSNTKNIYFCFCDCDLAHKAVMTDGDYIVAFNSIIATNQKAGLPMPTVNFTGRGFLLLWRVNRNGHDLNITDVDIKYWRMMQDYINDTFKAFEPDTGIKGDYAHVFRVLGTTNSKSGRECINLNLNSEITDIKALCDELGLNKITVKMRKTMALLQSNGAPEFDGKTKAEAYEYIYKYVNDYSNPATEAQVKYVTDIANKTGIEMPTILNYFTANAYIQENKHLLGNRTIKADHSMRANTAYKTARIIESLAECGEVTEGIRELTLACYHNCVLVYTAGDFDGAAEAVEELNARLAQPLPSNELKATHTNNLTKYSHAGWLQQITGKDWSELITYYDAPAKDRKESNKRTYENRLKKQGKETEINKIYTRRLQVKELLEQGKKQKEIVDLLKISPRTVASDKKYINENLSEFENVQNFKSFNYSYKCSKAEAEEKEEKKELPLIAIEVEEATEEINNIIGSKTEEEKEAEAIEYAMAQVAEYVANGYGDEDEIKNKYDDYDILSYMEHAENRITPDYAKRMAKTLGNYVEEEKYNLALFLKSYYYGYYGYTHKLVRSKLPYWVKNDLGAHTLYVELDTVEIDILDLGKLVNSVGWHGLQATPDNLHGAEILEFWAKATLKKDGSTRYKLYGKGETFGGHIVTMTFDDLQRVICGYISFEDLYKSIINK